MSLVIEELNDLHEPWTIDADNVLRIENEHLYKDSLDRLNLHRNTTKDMVSKVRYNYLQAFHPDKIKGNLELGKQLIQLERSFQFIKAYRIHKGTWE